MKLWQPGASTVERMLDDVEEYAGAVQDIRRRVKRHRPGSEAYHDLLPVVSAQVDILRLKAQHAAQALEEYEDSLSDGLCPSSCGSHPRFICRRSVDGWYGDTVQPQVNAKLGAMMYQMV